MVWSDAVIEAPSNRVGNATAAMANAFTTSCLFIAPPRCRRAFPRPGFYSATKTTAQTIKHAVAAAVAKKIEELRILCGFSAINGLNQQERSLESIRTV